jgi:hypothetical protein
VRAVADFDHDGKLDLVWRSTSTGQLRLWRLQFMVLEAAHPVIPVGNSPAGTDWQLL